MGWVRPQATRAPGLGADDVPFPFPSGAGEVGGELRPRGGNSQETPTVGTWGGRSRGSPSTGRKDQE